METDIAMLDDRGLPLDGIPLVVQAVNKDQTAERESVASDRLQGVRGTGRVHTAAGAVDRAQILLEEAD